jgi:hypothetical protein
VKPTLAIFSSFAAVPQDLPRRIGQFITDAMDGEQVPGFKALIVKFFNQLNNYLVQSSEKRSTQNIGRTELWFDPAGRCKK